MVSKFTGGDSRVQGVRTRHWVWTGVTCALVVAMCGCGRNRTQPAGPSDETVATSAPAELLELKPGTAAPLKIVLEKTEVHAGDDLPGRVVGNWLPSDNILRLAWVDGFQRVVNIAQVDQTPPVAEEGLAFNLKLTGGFGRKHELIALVAPRPNEPREEPGSWQVSARVSFRVTPVQSHWENYIVFLEGSSTQANRQFWQRAAESGINGVALHGGSLPPKAADSHAMPILVTGPLPGQLHPLGLSLPSQRDSWHRRFVESRKPLSGVAGEFFDDRRIAGSKATLGAWVRKCTRLGALGLSLGEAVSMGCGNKPVDIQPGTTTLEVYRGWLRQRYQDLKSLNAQWGTEYRSWLEVAPPTTDEVWSAHLPKYAERLETLRNGDKEKKPQPNGEKAPPEVGPAELPLERNENFSAWCDYRMFLQFVFSRMMGEYRAHARSIDTAVRTGVTNPLEPTAWGGYDWSQISRELDWCVLKQNSVARALLGSFGPRVPCLSTFTGNTPLGRWHLWSAWMNGDRGVRFKPARGWNGTLKDSLAEDFRELTGGVSLQRNGMAARRDPIAIYYSPRSIAVHWLLDSRTEATKWPMREGRRYAARDSALLSYRAWLLLLQDLGYAPQFIQPQQLLASGGKLEAKVLVLPKVLCLGEREAGAIREFAKFGGVVIADSQCGTFDAFGKRHKLGTDPVSVGTLDEAFGIKRSDFVANERDGTYLGDPAASVVLMEDPLKPVPTGPASPELRIDEPGVTRTTAWNYGRSPSGGQAVLSVSGGMGRFMYLNLAMQDYPKLRRRASAQFDLHGMGAARYAETFGRPTGGEALRVVVGDMLSEALGEPDITVRALNGTTLRGIKRAAWEYGEAVLVGLLPSRNAAPFGLEEGRPKWPKSVRLVYKKRLHWYDTRRGTYLGLGTSCIAPLETERATVLAGLPYAMREIESRVRRKDPRGSFKIKLSLDTSRDGAEGEGERPPHVLHVEVFDEGGRYLPHYTRNVVTDKDGEWEGIFDLAFNEPAGVYTWLVRDVLSGVRIRLPLTKGRQLLPDLFSAPVAASQSWDARTVDAGRVTMEADGSVVLRRTLQLAPRQRRLGKAPVLSIAPPHPWKLTAVNRNVPGAAPGNDPEMAPVPYEVVLRAPASTVGGGDPGMLVASVQGNAARKFSLPLRVLGIAPGSSRGIRVDGKLGDKGWGPTAQASLFLEAGRNTPAKNKTAVYARRNATHLLLGADLIDPNLPNLRNVKVKARSRDDLRFGQGDWFEVSISRLGAKAAPLRVRVDPAGNLWDAKGSNRAWNSKATAAVLSTKNGWSTEILIPWSDLGMSKAPVKGQSFRIAFARRSHLKKNSVEHSTWTLDSASSGKPATSMGLALIIGRK